MSLCELKWFKQLIQIFIPNDSRLYTDPDENTVSFLFLTIKTDIFSAHMCLKISLEQLIFKSGLHLWRSFIRHSKTFLSDKLPCSTSITVEPADGLSKLYFPYSQCEDKCLHCKHGRKKNTRAAVWEGFVKNVHIQNHYNMPLNILTALLQQRQLLYLNE